MSNAIEVGSPVKLVVPWGPNAGLITGFGEVVGSMNSNMDGVTFDIRRPDGTLNKDVAESWVKPAWG